MTNFIAFDLETTGFLAGVDQIIEIGAIRYINGQPDAMFCTLIDPGRPIPAAATAVNRITDEMVAGQPKIQEMLMPFADFCGDMVMVAHNAPFDFQFLVSDIKKHEAPAPRGLVLDTCAISRKVFRGLMNHKLGTLVQHLNIPVTGFHRAQEDAGYAGQLYLKILERITSADQAPAIENLIALSGGLAIKFPQIVRQPKQMDLLAGL